MENSNPVPEIQNLEPLRLPFALRIGKWLFWVTVILYVVYVCMTFYLDWKYVDNIDATIPWNMSLLKSMKNIFWLITLGFFIFWIIQFFRSKLYFSRMRIAIIMWIILFTLFGYQGRDFYWKIRSNQEAKARSVQDAYNDCIKKFNENNTTKTAHRCSLCVERM